MQLTVLGCSGGIGSGLKTTCFWVDKTTLIDAGTGLAELTVAELAAIDRIFITHAHLDHISMLPMLVDTVGAMRAKPLEVYASEATIEILHQHIFNWMIWPDFSKIPSENNPYMVFVPFECGESIKIKRDLTITALPAKHTVPAVGYQLDSGAASLVFTGDTTVNDALWNVVNAIGNLKYLIIETAFCNAERPLAELSRHLCPTLLASELSKLQRTCKIMVTHLKPGEIELTMQEISHDAAAFQPTMLYNGQRIEF